MGGYTSDLNRKEKEVIKAEVLKRDIHSSDEKGFSSSFINHQAVKVTMYDGKKYIIETGTNKTSKNPVSVTDASRSKEKWEKISEAPVNGKTVHDFVKSADPDREWSLAFNNCQHAAKRMMDDNVKK